MTFYLLSALAAVILANRFHLVDGIYIPTDLEDGCNCTCPLPVLDDQQEMVIGAAVASVVSLPVGMAAGGGALFLFKKCSSNISVKNILEKIKLEEVPSLELGEDEEEDEKEDEENDDKKKVERIRNEKNLEKNENGDMKLNPLRESENRSD